MYLFKNLSGWTLKFLAVATVAAALVSLFPRPTWAQDYNGGRDWDRDRDRDRDRVTRLEPGMTIPVRTTQAIDVNRTDNRVFSGVVDQDVYGDNGRLAIPRGSNVELIVRVARDNDLVIDLDSVMVNGQRYAISAEPNRAESQRDLVGSIVGGITGAEVRGQAVRIPRDAVLTFRLQRPLTMGVADRGTWRNGWHYHEYEHD
jgi:hypothetical protein